MDNQSEKLLEDSKFIIDDPDIEADIEILSKDFDIDDPDLQGLFVDDDVIYIWHLLLVCFRFFKRRTYQRLDKRV